MPGLGRYPCTACEYVGSNRRMLSRHVAVAHTDKVYKCPICPFITRYAANWYRHKRGVHGLSKLTTCEVCGFFANSPQDLTRHREAEHVQQDGGKHSKGNPLNDSEGQHNPGQCQESTDEVDRLDTPMLISCSQEAGSDVKFLDQTSVKDAEIGESVCFSLPVNGGLLENDVTLPGSSSKSRGSFSKTSTMNSVNPKYANLSPLKVRRSYCCDLCGLLTSDPREFLYHQRDIHKMRVNVHECKLCIYASKHIQKLQRHYNLVHRQKMPAAEKPSAPVVKSTKQRDAKIFLSDERFDVLSNSVKDKILPVCESPERAAGQKKEEMLKCSACAYQTKNKFLLVSHEKTTHLKKKFFKCLKCGYATNEKARYTKHIKYHNLPKMRCEFCHFRSAYKWNMERHMKNHILSSGSGEFSCTLCHFVTHSKQSLKMHVINHHNCIQGEHDDIHETSEVSDNTCIDSAEFEWENNTENSSYNFSEQDAFVPSDRFHERSVQKEVNFLPRSTSRKTLKCTECDFRTIWSFQLRKHKDTHKNNQKHLCKICGAEFEHISLLTKHVSAVHEGDAEVENVATNSNVTWLGKEKSPVFTHHAITNDVTDFSIVEKQVPSSIDRPKQSVLSSLLRDSSTSPGYLLAIPESDEIHKMVNEQSEKLQPSSATSEESSKFQRKENFAEKKGTHACKFCGYATRWLSELEKHMRVHSDEKPFQCLKCSYHSKWKGDLTRHVAKHHIGNKFVGNKLLSLPKLKEPTGVNPRIHWKSAEVENSREFREQDSPLDLTVSKESIFHSVTEQGFAEVDEVSDGIKISDLCMQREKSFALYSELDDIVASSSQTHEDFKTFLESPASLSGQKYFCPFCAFSTSTPSRFHVHIVQHYNKKPFMCSECGYHSNWEWDVTKHIRLRGCMDKEHNSACVLLTDETGKRNYEKYEKYLRDADEFTLGFPEHEVDHVDSSLQSTNHDRQATSREHVDSTEVPEDLSVDEGPENIIVTPDIPFANDSTDEADFLLSETEIQNSKGDKEVDGSSFRFYLCKHCNYKHSSRKVIIGHLSVHAGVRPFRCRVCGLTSNWRHTVVRHVKEAHNGYMNDVEDRISYVQEGFVIRITSVKSSNKPEVMSSASRTAPFTCKFCPYKCDKEVYIRFHMKQHKPREGAVHQCTFCPYYVKFKKTLVRHMKLHEMSEDQENNFSSEKRIGFSTEHEQLTGGCMFTETDSPKGSSEAQSGAENEESIRIRFDQLNAPEVLPSDVSRNKRHVCENCPYKTDNRTQYLYHKQFHRPNNSAPFKCSLCSYWATLQHLLTQHMRVHRKDEPGQVSSNAALKGEATQQSESVPNVNQSACSSQITAILVQRGGVLTKMFKCRFCPMMNKKRANVRVHERMHGEMMGDGKYTCNLCNYKCSGQGSLTNHMKIHQNSEDQLGSTLQEDTRVDCTDHPLKKKVFSYFCMRCPAVFKSSSDLYIHKSFHGSSLPFPCPHCDYRAKHKPHLHKHLQVHTIAYVSKRDASFGPSVSPGSSDVNENVNSEGKPDTLLPRDKKIDQMLLLEAADVKMSMKRGKEFAKMLHKCTFCPSLFSKAAVLAYHMTQHGSSGEFGCSQCDYATTRSANLSVHVQTHARVTSPVKRAGRILQCPKCPAQFSKADRYERHLSLHGKNYRFMCNKCDYSVRFAANLSKHRLMHTNAESSDHTSMASDTHPDKPVCSAKDNDLTVVTTTAALQPSPISSNQNINESKAMENEEKKIYACDRCPYFQGRKDAVQSHQNRHFQKEGYLCPHCDYRSMGSSFLREHVKSHVQQNSLYPPQTFLKYGRFEIWSTDGSSKQLIFLDKGLDKELYERFHPTFEETDRIFFSGVSCQDIDSVFRSSISDKNHVYSDDFKNESREDKISFDSSASSSSSSSSSVTVNKLVPHVVLTDIFSQSKGKTPDETGVHLKLSKKKSTEKAEISDSCSKKILTKKSAKSESLERTERNSSKSSIIVKIKVENIVEDNNERPLYTISSSSSRKNCKSESCSDAASDVTLPVDDLEDYCPENDHGSCASASKVLPDEQCSVLKDSFIDNKETYEELQEVLHCDNGACSLQAPRAADCLQAETCTKPVSSEHSSEDSEVDFLKQLKTVVNGVHPNSLLSDTNCMPL